jgi:hypothetical protein
LAGLALATSLSAQSSGIGTYCNPIDIDYKYNFEQINEGISYRSGADPVIVNHRGEYFLFVTVSGGYWHSKSAGKRFAARWATTSDRESHPGNRTRPTRCSRIVPCRWRSGR